jgi:acyl carrier protein
MTDGDPLITRVRAIVERVVGADRTPQPCGPDTPLADGFWLDSIELVEVLVSCEEEFGIVLDETADIESGAFGTLGTLSALVRSKLSPGAPLP